MSIDPAEVMVIVEILEDGRKANYANVASLALVIFDYLLTFRQEVELVWLARRWSLGSIIFVAFRYYGLAAQIFDDFVWVNTSADFGFCAPAIKFQVATTVSILGLTEAILTYRVWIMYDRSKYLGSLLALVLIGNWATVTAFGVKVFAGTLTGSPFPPPLGSGCDTIGIPIPNYLFLSIIPHAIMAVLLLLLTAGKTYHSIRADKSQTPTSSLLLRDGLLYFACTVAIELVNGMFFRFARLSMKGAATGFQIAIPYTMTCRLFLNIRSLLLHPPDLDNSTWDDSTSISIHFAIPTISDITTRDLGFPVMSRFPDSETEVETLEEPIPLTNLTNPTTSASDTLHS